MKVWLSDMILTSFFYLFRIFPIKRNKIVLTSYLGKGYGDNGKYIVEALLRRKKKYDIVWLAKNTEEKFPKGIRVVRYRSIKSIYEQVTAKIWIDNRRKPNFVRKRNNQCYIQTWHGNMALKKLEKDVESSLDPRYVAAAKNDSKMLDIFLSGSSWETNCIRNAFWFDKNIQEIGYPRQDPFANEQKRLSEKIRKAYDLPSDTKILLYAPTFRQSRDEKSLSVYSLNWSSVLNALEQRFGGKWVGMIRLHPNVSDLVDKLNIPNNVYSVTEYNDMQELVAGCNCLITDYSSTVMEAGVAGKIGLIFATDFEEYQKDRDVYLDIRDDLPFPFSDNNEQLVHNILNFDQQKYEKELHHFLYDFYGCVCNGDASDKVCDIIDNVIANKA